MNAEADRRGFIPVNEQMQVVDKSGKALKSVYCIGDANGKLEIRAASSSPCLLVMMVSPVLKFKV